MIGHLRGILLEKSPEVVLIDVGGVGYTLESPASSLWNLPPVGHEASLFVHTHVREDAIKLYGFAHLFDRRVFEALLSVTGVGPRLALALLGPWDGKELCEAVVDGDLPRLVKIPGVGTKTAERILLELKTRLQKLLARNREDEESQLQVARAAQVAVPVAKGLVELNAPLPPLAARGPAQLFDAPLVPAQGAARPSLTKATHESHMRVKKQHLIDDLKSALGNMGWKEKEIVDVVGRIETDLKTKEDLPPLETLLRDSLKRLSGRIVSGKRES